MNAGSKHRVYPYELKLSAVKDRLENGMTVREVMVKHGIPSESSVKAWCRLYRTQGAEALVNKPRGVKPRHLREAAANEKTSEQEQPSPVHPAALCNPSCSQTTEQHVYIDEGACLV